MDQSFLQEGFDPRSLKVPELRNILNEYNISFPSTAKKTELISLFNDNVYKNRTKLLDAINAGIANANEDSFEDLTGDKNAKQKKQSDDPKQEPEAKSKKPKKKETKKKESKTKVTKPKTKKKDVKELDAKIESGSETPRGSVSKESTMSPENIFQSPPSASRTRKRKAEEEKVEKKKEGKKGEKKPKLGGLFDNEDDADEFHKELLKGFTPKKVKPTSAQSTPTRSFKEDVSTPKLDSIDKELEEKDEKEVAETKDVEEKVLDLEESDDSVVEIEKPESAGSAEASKSPKVSVESPTVSVESPKSPKVAAKSPKSPKVTAKSPKSPKVTAKSPKSPESTPKSPKSPKSTKSPVIKSPTGSRTPKSPSTVKFSPSTKQLSLDEEIKDFDANRKNKVKDSPSTPPVAQPPKVTLTPGPKLTPKPRKTLFDAFEKPAPTPQEDSGSESDEDSNDEEETEAEKTEEPAKSRARVPRFLFIYLLVWFVLSLAGIFGYWYREQTFLIGYCGHSIDEPTFYDPEYPVLNKLSDTLDSFKPQCVKCPSHARCFSHLELGCFEDFIESKPWYYDLVPFLGPTEKKCIPDTKKAEKLESMIQFSLDLLRSKNALVNCGKGESNFESGLTQGELYSLLLSMKAPYITVEEFDELWERSIVELEKEPEIIVELPSDHTPTHPPSDDEGHEKENSNKILRSTSLQNLDLKCQLQNTLVLTLYNNKEYIIGVMVLAVVMILVKLQYDEYEAQKQKINSVYHDVISKLKHQKTQPIKYIGANQLRDLLLVETNLKYKLKLWKAISAKIEKNSNVNYRLIEHHGEIVKVWEWISEVDT